jgi:serine/threonine-protein kinase HipA
MSLCPITYEELQTGESKYSVKGLQKISASLKNLKDFPFSADEQRREAALRAGKMSIQGVQPKLSAIVDTREQAFRVVDQYGQFILKPQNPIYLELPENEDVTMRLAKTIGLNTPLHGLIYCSDQTKTYFIKRFDRGVRNKKIALEDFAQLSGKSRDTKYESSMEQVAKIIEKFCTFPLIQKAKLLKLTLFNYLVGNEDMHLKNFSLITNENIVELSPAYDLLNSSIANPRYTEEIALPLDGKKKNLTRSLFLHYYAKDRLGLTQNTIDDTLNTLQAQFPIWEKLINICFLSSEMKTKYKQLINLRKDVLFRT